MPAVVELMPDLRANNSCDILSALRRTRTQPTISSAISPDIFWSGIIMKASTSLG